MSTKLAGVIWGSGPGISAAFRYDARRSGADMQYKIYVEVNAVQGASYFGFPIYLDVTMAGDTKVSRHTLKTASPSQWSSAITYESGWLTVADKSSGITSLKLRLYSGSGSQRDTTYSYYLPIVPAASDIAAAFDVTAGNKCCVKWKPLGGYYYKLKFTLGDFSHTETVGKMNTSTAYIFDDYTIPVSNVANQLPSAVSGTMTVTLYTYADSGYDSLVGSDSKTCKVTLPSSVKPAASLSVALDNSASSVINGWNIAVKGYTKLCYDATGSKSVYGATIKSYAFSFAGQSKTASSGTTDKIERSGTLTPKVTVKDSRGRTDSKSAAAIKVYDYAKPTLSGISVYRCDGSGKKTDDGKYIRVYAKAGCSSLGGRNAVTLRMRTKTLTGSYGEYTTLTSGSTRILSGFDTETAYVVEISAVDSVDGKKKVTVTVPTAKVTLHLREGGNGAAFGKYSQRAALECAWDAYFEKKIYMGGKSMAPARLSDDAFQNNTNYFQNHSVQVWEIPALGMVLFRGYCDTGVHSLESGTTYSMGRVATAYRPAVGYAVAAYCSKGGVNAKIISANDNDEAGRIVICPNVDIGATSKYGIYVTGFWFI